MQQYILLLRAINVGTGRTVKMAELVKLLEAIGCTNITTYIQSGNVVLQHKAKTPEAFAKLAQDELAKHYTFDIACIATTAKALQAALKKCPFKDELEGKAQTYIAFCQASPTAPKTKAFDASVYAPDQIAYGKDVIYVHYQAGASSTKLTNALIEKKLDMTTTMRNLNTCNKLLDLCAQ
jgi:uncharacterized protein (DUF1697 family)